LEAENPFGLVTLQIPGMSVDDSFFYQLWLGSTAALDCTANPFPVMTTGISLCINSHREIPVLNTGSRGVPCNENRFFPVRITTQGKPCSGPVLALYGVVVNLY
jgi:hypothetical protein